MNRRNILSLLALTLAFFVVAFLTRNDDSGALGVIGAIGWYGFLLCALLTLVAAAITFVRRSRRPAGATHV